MQLQYETDKIIKFSSGPAGAILLRMKPAQIIEIVPLLLKLQS